MIALLITKSGQTLSWTRLKSLPTSKNFHVFPVFLDIFFSQAVELDDLKPVDDLVKHSSSAVDIRTVLMQVTLWLTDWLTDWPSDCLTDWLTDWYLKFEQILKHPHFQVKTFWSQLNWPDVEASYAFISKILDVRTFICIHFFTLLHLTFVYCTSNSTHEVARLFLLLMQ